MLTAFEEFWTGRKHSAQRPSPCPSPSSAPSAAGLPVPSTAALVPALSFPAAGAGLLCLQDLLCPPSLLCLPACRPVGGRGPVAHCMACVSEIPVSS